jgi:potassium-transporting ATPase potassium-binding subunit
MSTSTAGFLFVLSLVVALAVAYRPLGDYLHLVATGTKHSRLERSVYRLVGVNPAAEQTWGVYARSVLAFSAVSILFLYAFQRLQDKFCLSLGLAAVPSSTAWNTAVSFTTNPPPADLRDRCADKYQQDSGLDVCTVVDGEPAVGSGEKEVEPDRT